MEGAQRKLFWNLLFRISIYVMGLDYFKFSLKKKNWIQIGIKFHVLRFEIGIIFKLCSVKVLWDMNFCNPGSTIKMLHMVFF